MKSFNTFIAEEKKATITKKESYRGRTTADVEYNVHDENGRHIRTTKTKKDYFPFFAFIICDVFHLIERPLEADKMLQICNTYEAPNNEKLTEIPIEAGYFKVIELMNGLSAYHLGDHKKAKRILNSIEVQTIPFIFRNYFLIQMKRIEYKLCVKASSKKKTSIYNEIEALIEKTGFVFFDDHKTI